MLLQQMHSHNYQMVQVFNNDKIKNPSESIKVKKLSCSLKPVPLKELVKAEIKGQQSVDSSRYSSSSHQGRNVPVKVQDSKLFNE